MSVGVIYDVGTASSYFENGLVTIDFDVALSEVHEWTNDVTTSPVEEGSPIADHIRPLPDRLTIKGMITNATLASDVSSIISSKTQIDGDGAINRTQTAFDFLRKMKEDRLTVTVYTKYNVYPDMALKSVTIPRDTGLGEAIQFTAEFEHIRIVSTQTTDVPAGISKKADKKADSETAKKAEPQAKAGAKQPKDVTSEKSASVLDGMIEGVKNLF
jgi:hypothetical protein